ncbi:hypothetical protein [Aeromonas piscicola]|uniref:hypothetical protein n=1 Tax=Aeromonas piscicola TaxID=600645 RepID=UPI0021F87FBC|nr:hypothetical protein [Aeromonas piscicola]MCW0507024.1 hypothetical protein [Aeromonas piscicola]
MNANVKVHDFKDEDSACFVVKTTAVVEGVDILNGKEEVHITVTGNTIHIEVVRMIDDTESKKELVFSASNGQLIVCDIHDAEAEKRMLAKTMEKKMAKKYKR